MKDTFWAQLCNYVLLLHHIMKWNLCDNSCLKKGRSGKMWLWLTLLPIPHSKWMFSVPYTDNETLSGSARLPVSEGCMCRLCVSNVTEKRKEVCVQCRRASSPYETKGDFCLFGGTMRGCEAVHRAQNVCHVFCKCAFFCKYHPLWAGQSCSSLFGQQGHMGVQLNPQ